MCEVGFLLLFLYYYYYHTTTNRNEEFFCFNLFSQKSCQFYLSFSSLQEKSRSNLYRNARAKKVRCSPRAFVKTKKKLCKDPFLRQSFLISQDLDNTFEHFFWLLLLLLRASSSGHAGRAVFSFANLALDI